MVQTEVYAVKQNLLIRSNTIFLAVHVVSSVDLCVALLKTILLEQIEGSSCPDILLPNLPVGSP